MFLKTSRGRGLKRFSPAPPAAPRRWRISTCSAGQSALWRGADAVIKLISKVTFYDSKHHWKVYAQLYSSAPQPSPRLGFIACYVRVVQRLTRRRPRKRMLIFAPSPFCFSHASRFSGTALSAGKHVRCATQIIPRLKNLGTSVRHAMA